MHMGLQACGKSENISRIDLAMQSVRSHAALTNLAPWKLKSNWLNNPTILTGKVKGG